MKTKNRKSGVLYATKKDNWFIAPEGLNKIQYLFLCWQVDRQQKKIKK